MPSRLSTARKAAAGTLRPSRLRDTPAAERLQATPRPPAGLDPTAAAEWKALAPLLVSSGVLTAADLRTLRLLCETLADVAALAATIKAEGLTIESATGARKAHPALNALGTSRALAHRMLSDFGLSPRSRGGVDAAPDGSPPADPASRYF